MDGFRRAVGGIPDDYKAKSLNTTSTEAFRCYFSPHPYANSIAIRHF